MYSMIRGWDIDRKCSDSFALAWAKFGFRFKGSYGAKVCWHLYCDVSLHQLDSVVCVPPWMFAQCQYIQSLGLYNRVYLNHRYRGNRNVITPWTPLETHSHNTSHLYYKSVSGTRTYPAC